jgi:glycosyltransferase involved in cell wall biosynthesis
MIAPTVSVIIPTYNRPDLIRACLAGLERLTFPQSQFEVIVVDDGSPEPIEGVIADFAARLNVRHIRQDRAGPGAARNTGVAQARGRYAAFIDDDCVPAADWLNMLVETLERDPSSMAGGRVTNILVSNRYADASDRISAFVYDYYQGPAQEPFFTTNNLAVAVDRFRELGGFTTSIPSATAEDKEFCDRWRGKGWPLVPVPGAVVNHAHNLTLYGFLRQHFNYGRGILAFRLIRRARVDGPIVPESLGFYAGLLASPLRTGGGVRAMTLVALAQVATAAGALREWLAGTRPPAEAGR